MRNYKLTAVCASMVLLGCGGGGGDSNPPIAPTTVTSSPTKTLVDFRKGYIQLVSGSYAATDCRGQTPAGYGQVPNIPLLIEKSGKIVWLGGESNVLLTTPAPVDQFLYRRTKSQLTPDFFRVTNYFKKSNVESVVFGKELSLNLTDNGGDRFELIMNGPVMSQNWNCSLEKSSVAAFNRSVYSAFSDVMNKNVPITCVDQSIGATFKDNYLLKDGVLTVGKEKISLLDNIKEEQFYVIDIKDDYYKFTYELEKNDGVGVKIYQNSYGDLSGLDFYSAPGVRKLACTKLV